ncbi:site-specific recombinase, phage integrase family [Sphingobacterium spiritivorum ATCC 33300]|uniref:Site-specific recombinase, phage integrase family n=1 Tax=Sphingobacterium spiritivorum ATCC 33300 TaxID=525372 RepID=C2G4U6_SPHSI|nr:site-specific integrase [Sphingobacterium spiritivorum]EEI89697.1 site-specific recombinase, phage integrase family [Sphingobacterium spiritivorum ATCC 33300]QQS94770.1 site-specific integrase [Sphingobacterium spiritivorum]
MKTNFSLLFYLKRPKDYTTGIVPIYLRITVNGKRAELATGKECEPEQWNSKIGHIRGTKEDTKTFNAYLDKMKAGVTTAYTTLCLQDDEVTTESIKCKYLGKAEKPHTLVEAITLHNKNMKALVGKDYAQGTLKRFEVLERHVLDFLAFQYRKNDINIKSIDHDFISAFDFYLRTEKANTNNTAIKHLKNLGKNIRICISKKWINADPFFGYKLKSKDVHRDYLTATELQKIVEKEFTTLRLSQVRDFFLFSCYTGLSYADVQKLKPADIRIGADGEPWIITYRQKTNTRAAIPLLPVAKKILDRYKDHPMCINKGKALPISSNQKMNEYLIEIAALAGVDKTLGNRIAKRTFATTVTLMNGVPIESVSKMLGHTNLRTTQLYAKILDEKVASDMAPLREIFTSI